MISIVMKYLLVQPLSAKRKEKQKQKTKNETREVEWRVCGRGKGS
jgi:hypothetical protein